MLTRSGLRSETSAICDAVLDSSDAEQRLRALTDADLFVSRAHSRGEVFHVHGLFREMLQDELRSREPALEPELHRRACAAYREHADWERAIRHAVDAGDAETAADLMWELVPWCMAQGRSETLKRWYMWLTDAEVAEHPHAALAPGWAARSSSSVARRERSSRSSGR